MAFASAGVDGQQAAAEFTDPPVQGGGFGLRDLDLNPDQKAASRSAIHV